MAYVTETATESDAEDDGALGVETATTPASNGPPAKRQAYRVMRTAAGLCHGG